jgi:fimbrial chaperone protein
MKAFVGILALALQLLTATSAAAQSSVVIWPVDPQIKAGDQATALWLENRGREPVTLQVRSFNWNQSQGEDSYEEQDAIVSSPPIATVGAGERQLVRVIRRAPDTAGEHAYRLVVDELPRPPAAGGDGVSAHLAVQMRYSIPLFTFGASPAELAPTLSAHVALSAGKRWLEVTNSGSSHARLTDLRVGSATRASTLKAGLVGYVLPGATMRWELPDEFPVGAHFIVAVNGVDQTLGQTS